MLNLSELTIGKTHTHLMSGDFSARELTEAYCAEIEKKNPALNAYLEVFLGARADADRADKALKEGNAGALTGIPLAVKDNILVKGERATCGSRILEGYRATYDAGVIERLKKENAVFLGRTNMDEFAMGSSTEHSAFGAAKNPHDESRVPGGSSGGSAAAVAADIALGALGSDTGGSVRQPAAFCGIVGMKPTYGAVSRRGLVALASSLDQISPFAKTVGDAEILFRHLRAHDPMDSTSAPESLWEKHPPRTDAKRIGVPRHLFAEGGVDADMQALFDAALERLRGEGYIIEEIALPNLRYALAAYYIVMPAEASANLARFDGVRYGLKKAGGSVLEEYEETRGAGFGDEPRMRILLGAFVLSAGYHDAYYRKATALRGVLRREMDEAFGKVDFIAMPTTPTPAFKRGEKMSDPVSMYLSDIFTVPANITGIPALSLPMGSVLRDGVALPAGFQFMAPHFGDSSLFAVGKDLEKLIAPHR
ncbi:glutaminyl-tRNA synthase (glutamine-hydrolyzing) subunit A [Candidatus Kaiserbacteria bacterium RIFCSPLOWO2_01_FULL_53_17]|uniref:Glutamyl-tRNA(Gln) amidotransferase subunit A n=1 Tax=Candidatus Kaiserbacteria bacterium RIFCSPLOWO2_01_FULL_53_17 TaxID=1798511 RepID=A0A1F6EG34_9BACT|nr:MAG: glutaminyl-tRNA synthase (glutamine-hydrolyzing) subunit A [Candidatus Kaiserbacteria bacterium RIFCSPLOWO2_01_FULL_53_17]